MDTLGIDEVIVGDRDRTDLGDINRLAASIAKDGLLHPVVVNDEGVLVAGRRRLEAVRRLGWATVPVTQVTFDTAADMLSAEMAENTCRKDLTPVEAERARARRARLLAPEAEKREKAGIRPSGNVPQGRTRDLAAIGTGYSGRTLDKVAEVREAAEDDGLPDPIREVAREQMEAMEQGTTNPTQALRLVRDVRKELREQLYAERKKQAMKAPRDELQKGLRRTVFNPSELLQQMGYALQPLALSFIDRITPDDYNSLDLELAEHLVEILSSALPRLKRVQRELKAQLEGADRPDGIAGVA